MVIKSCSPGCISALEGPIRARLTDTFLQTGNNYDVGCEPYKGRIPIGQVVAQTLRCDWAIHGAEYSRVIHIVDVTNSSPKGW